jgi:hypothetical protein
MITEEKSIKLEIGKSYLTRHGRFVTIVNEPWEGIYNGDYEKDGRQHGIWSDSGRWAENGRCWNFIFNFGSFYISEHDILMEDCEHARKLAEEMKLERKKKAYEETM